MPNEPWLYGDNWRFGPMTLTDEQRRLAEARWREIQAEGGGRGPRVAQTPQADNLGFDPNVNPHGYDPQQQREAYERFRAGESGGIADLAAPSMPRQEFTWPAELNPKSTPPMPDVPPGPGLPVGAEGEYERAARTMGAAGIQRVGDTSPPPKPMTPQEIMVEEVRKRKEMLDTLFPRRDQDDTDERARADQYAEREKQRTNLLARLAFSSGLTAAGGGSWKEIAKGFAQAGVVHDEGFQRYHETLIDAARRSEESREAEYADELARAEAAYELYTQSQKAALDQESDRRKEILDFWKDIKPDAGEGGILDPDEWQRWKDAYGFEVGVVDVRD